MWHEVATPSLGTTFFAKYFSAAPGEAKGEMKKWGSTRHRPPNNLETNQIDHGIPDM